MNKFVAVLNFLITSKLRKLLIGFIILTAIVSSWLIMVKATVTNPCDPELIIDDIIIPKIFQYEDVFFTNTNNESKKSTIKTNLMAYYDKNFKEISSDKTVDNYHQIQKTLFKDAINHVLQNISTSEVNQTTSDQFLWTDLKDTTKHPIMAIYAEKANNKPKEVSQIVPTLVLSIESSLNYTFFSCTYQADASALLKKSNNLQDFYLLKSSDQAEQLEEVYNAKKVVEYALNSYDSLTIALPQHLEYLKLIDEAEKLRDEFDNLNNISSSCVRRNHANQSCQ